MDEKTLIIKNTLQNFYIYLQNKGLRYTLQRQKITKIFLKSIGHLTIEEIYRLVKKEDLSLGQATVYRTIKLLCEAGIAKEVRFSDGIARYEHSFNEHHDHLICDICGIKLEFVEHSIEKLQKKLIQKYGFIPTHHRLYLYGICPECQKSYLQ